MTAKSRRLANSKMAREIVFLLRERRDIPVPIQPRLADCDDPRRFDEMDHRIPIIRLRGNDIVGLNPDARPNRRVLRRDLNTLGAVGGCCRDTDDVRNANARGAFSHDRQVTVEAFVGQVCVSIKQHGRQTRFAADIECNSSACRRFSETSSLTIDWPFVVASFAASVSRL